MARLHRFRLLTGLGLPRRSWRLTGVLVTLLYLTSTLLVSAQSTVDATAQDGDAVAGEGGATGGVAILAFDDPDNFTLAGRLGVGAETPAYVIDARDNRNTTGRVRLINGSNGVSAASDFYVQTAGAGQGVALAKFGAGNTGVWGGQPLANRAWLRTDTNVTGLILATGGNAPLIFGANNVEWMRLNPNGFVGINNSAPTSPLHINGSAAIPGVPLRVTANGNWQSAIFESQSYAVLQLRPGTGEADRIELANGPDGSFRILTSAQEAVTVLRNGRVGIGATNPTAKLEVVGDLRLTSGAGGAGDLWLNNPSLGYGGLALTGSSDGSDTLILNGVNTFGGGVLIQSHAKVANNFIVGGFTTLGADLLMNAGAPRGDGGRALVHDSGDTLTLNYANDFAGGVRTQSKLEIAGDLRLTNGPGGAGDLWLNNSTYGYNGLALTGSSDGTDTLVLNGVNTFAGGVRVDSGMNVRGSLQTDVLVIDGGADLAEPFAIANADTIEPGMVVAIDAENPGQLRLATAAYDRTVAGVVSGAGGINPGLILQQEGSVAVGDHPVALTGRVYVYADASNGPIIPGDLLTTANTPGHAMKVTDYDRAQGAILGKAMSKLEEGTGLVLVLVTLQ